MTSTLSKILQVASALAWMSLSACEGGPRSGHGALAAETASGSGEVLPGLFFDQIPPAPSASASSPMGLLGPPPAAPAHDVRMPTDWRADYRWNGNERVAHAKQSKGSEVQSLFDAAGVSFPPHDVLFRIFKKEGEFEVWAGDADQPMKLVATYGICAASGVLGPKRREGDLQVPEGYYKVGYYHPMSSYYLSAQVDYPNASDKVRGGPALGGDILIHGSCASIGCISMTDERIEEIYLVGWSAFLAGRPTNIHIFPARDIDALLKDPSLDKNHDFWREIEPGLKDFDASHRVPEVRIEKDGRYVITPAS